MRYQHSLHPCKAFKCSGGNFLTAARKDLLQRVFRSRSARKQNFPKQAQSMNSFKRFCVTIGNVAVQSLATLPIYHDLQNELILGSRSN
jgi:hypothetical protein